MASKKLGLYVHTPFCLKKCSYCAFASVEVPRDTSSMCTALQAELKKKISGHNYQFQTLYAGGGTPTLLPIVFWKKLIDLVRTPSLREVTIETNPAVLDKNGYSSLLQAGFNRMSIGIQTFNENNLKILGRIHSADEGWKSLKLARQSGFKNVSLDLMYGLPEQTLSSQKLDIEKALQFMPEHISAYDLTLEPGTPLGDKGIKASEESSVEMYYQIHDLLTTNGYHHYEVSSYSLGKEKKSIHNSSYWNRTEYLGIGPSAHEFIGNTRSWNYRDVQPYESSLQKGKLPVESNEELTPENIAHEMLSLGFRNTNGIDLTKLKETGFILNPHDLLETGLVKMKGNVLSPNKEGMLYADSLALTAAQLLDRYHEPQVSK